VIVLGPPYVRLSGAVVLIYTDMHTASNLVPRYQDLIYFIMFSMHMLVKVAGFKWPLCICASSSTRSPLFSIHM
jgi:hypothetical protein